VLSIGLAPAAWAGQSEDQELSTPGTLTVQSAARPATESPATESPATEKPAKDSPAKDSPAKDSLEPEARSAVSVAKKPGVQASGAKPLLITPEREAAAMTFVRQHHAELSELLIYLKESAPREYERAVRDLFRASERLAQIQERDSAAYELELNLWKARSRAQLISARLQMADDPQLRDELRAALTDEYDLRVRVLKYDRERLADRLRNLDEQIGRLEARRAEFIENQWQGFFRARAKGKPPARAKGVRNKQAPKPAEDKPG
jgi:hypothetical protein